jgi:hypothetical protein
MEQKHREGESGPIPTRSDRFYLLENHWFFATREGSPIGPFETREEGVGGIQDFLEFLKLAKPKTLRKFEEAMEA